MKKLTLMAMVFAISIQVNAKVWRVNNTAGVDADFTSFKQAHDGASIGDTLMFEGSIDSYGSNDTLFKTLTMIGPGYFIEENYPENDNVLTAILGAFYIDTLAASSVIKGMEFSYYDQGYADVRVSANNIILERNYFIRNIVLGYENPIVNVVIAKNYISSTIESATYYITSRSTNVLITNNIINTVKSNEYCTSTITNNDIENVIALQNATLRNNIVGYLSGNSNCSFEYNLIEQELPENGVGNVFIEDLEGVYAGKYISGTTLSQDGQYQLTDTSAAIGIGENGVDCGAFGGNVPYVLSGFPPVPLVTDVSIPAQVTNELTIKIKAKAQE